MTEFSRDRKDQKQAPSTSTESKISTGIGAGKDLFGSLHAPNQQDTALIYYAPATAAAAQPIDRVAVHQVASGASFFGIAALTLFVGIGQIPGSDGSGSFAGATIALAVTAALAWCSRRSYE